MDIKGLLRDEVVISLNDLRALDYRSLLLYVDSID